MLIKTTELTARALDWAVGVAVDEYVEPHLFAGDYIVVDADWNTYSPTTNWGQLGLLLESERVAVSPESHGKWCAEWYWDGNVNPVEGVGDTPLIAACRAIVAARIGDQVDVPEVLL